jgi:hypothetical protein
MDAWGLTIGQDNDKICLIPRTRPDELCTTLSDLPDFATTSNTKSTNPLALWCPNKSHDFGFFFRNGF